MLQKAAPNLVWSEWRGIFRLYSPPNSTSKYSLIYNLLICRLAAILNLYVIGYLYRQYNLTNEFLDLKLVEKEVLVEMF